MIVLQPFFSGETRPSGSAAPTGLFYILLEALHCIATIGSFIVRCGIKGYVYDPSGYWTVTVCK